MCDARGLARFLEGYTVTPDARHARLMQALARKRESYEPARKDGPERFWTARPTRALCRRKERKR